MNDKQLEKHIKRAFKAQHEDISAMKEEVWVNIESIMTQKRSDTYMPVKRRSSKFKIFGSVAAAVIAVSFTFSTPGQAMMGSLKDLFAPNKTVVQTIEGTPEKSKVSVTVNESVTPSKASYAIYADENKYSINQHNGTDRIVPLVDMKGLPEVYMEISQVEKKSPEQLFQEQKTALTSKYPLVSAIGPVSNPVHGFLIQAQSGEKSDSIFERYYFVDNAMGGSFVIKQKLFVEAAEGHGSRFDEMLKEFQVIKN
jgi:hypothetical protein